VNADTAVSYASGPGVDAASAAARPPPNLDARSLNAAVRSLSRAGAGRVRGSGFSLALARAYPVLGGAVAVAVANELVAARFRYPPPARRGVDGATLERATS
jgi:hypothetical protein